MPPPLNKQHQKLLDTLNRELTSRGLTARFEPSPIFQFRPLFICKLNDSQIVRVDPDARVVDVFIHEGGFGVSVAASASYEGRGWRERLARDAANAVGARR